MSMAEIFQFSTGDRIFGAGEPCVYFYVLLAGTAALWTEDEKMMQLGPSNVIGAEIKDAAGIHSYSCTAIADSDLRVRRYPIASLGDLLGNARFAQMVCSSLMRQSRAQLNFFERYRREREYVYYSGEIKAYEPGETVIREGDDSTDIFRIISTDKGLKVIKNECELAVIREPGEFFGEMAALLHEPRTASVVSAGQSVLEVYPSEQLNDIIKDYPDISLRMIQNMAKRLADTSAELAKS
ncbi:MAG: cyclic nucleotide-binding domain-containing protein [Thermodesulfobacteriota bacterium]